MNIKYKIKKYSLGQNHENILIRFSKEDKMIESYLNSIHTKDIGNWIIDGIDSVLSGKTDYIERDTESSGTKIHKDFTKIYDALNEDNHEEQTIPTQDLRELVVIWTKALEDFNNEKESK